MAEHLGTIAVAKDAPTSTDVIPDWLDDRSLELEYRETLAAILMDGALVDAVSGTSAGAGRSTLECRNYSFELASGRDRILTLEANHVRATLAVGRFFWMMAGNDRLDDIRFYGSDGLKGDRKAGVGKFSDDGLSIPGSNYGQRLFRPRPGVDQVAACIELVRDDPNTRRAAMTVYQPEDAGRDSGDVPCTFGVLLGPRDGLLHQTVVMRSNNAWMLLPYNIFEFSLLGEIIASETKLEVGTYHHFAVSMHLYESDVPKAFSAVSGPAFVMTPFGEMPTNSLSRVREMCKWESWVRYASAGFTKREADAELRRTKSFGEYWAQFARVALYKALQNYDKFDSADKVANAVGGPLGELLDVERAEADVSGEAFGQLALELRSSPIPPLSEESLARMSSDRVARDERDRVNGRFHLMSIRADMDERREAADHS